MSPETVELLRNIGSIAGAIALALVAIFRQGAQRYVDEKAKNLATTEDVRQITKEVEDVKAAYHRESHAWKWIFEQEYQLLETVWSSTWDFQATARSLRPMFDRLPEDSDAQRQEFLNRHAKYGEAVTKFQDLVIKSQPFIPPHVYDKCLELRELVVALQVDFEMSLDDGGRANWEVIVESGRKLDTKLSELNSAIRSHIHDHVDSSS
jgi:hypothetical protein